MSPNALRKTHLFIILLSVFLSSCINELKLIKVKGREPIPYEFTPSIHENIEEPIISINPGETIQTPKLTSPDGSEKEIPASSNEEEQTIVNQLKKNQSYQQLNKTQQVKIKKLAIKKAEKLKKKSATAPPPMKANIIIGSILTIAGIVLIIGGIASLFTAASAAVYIILGVLVFIVGAILVFRGVAVRRHDKIK